MVGYPVWYYQITPGVLFTKGLSQISGLTWLCFYTEVKPKTWLRPFVNTAPGICIIIRISLNALHCPLTALYCSPLHFKYKSSGRSAGL